MRSILAWLIIAGVFTGVIGRASAHALRSQICCDHSHEMVAAAIEDCESGMECDGHHSVLENEEKEDVPGPDKQEHHHHHHICCAGVLLFAYNHWDSGFAAIEGSRTLLSLDRSVAPEEPVFELDMPPLI